MPEIYGAYADYLPLVMQEMVTKIQDKSHTVKTQTGFKLYEHLLYRIKSPESMMEKCQRKGLPQTPQSALKAIRDAIGIRVVCGFVDDIYQTVAFLRQLPDVTIVQEKDYITKAKPNGYRSYHLILEVKTPYPDCLGQAQGTYFIEVQLRTLAMDSWASLEHQMKYKHHISNAELITEELKRCSDELASCDLTMQTIRQLIAENKD
ncbi:GTP pyrophosphokinase [Streptococcus sp. DD12]|uniref:GTP pyrophosphokinase n=1 Tax=Streptococcus sp. DD12 TaxID=1777880 RepID=UPI00079C3374|nr:GTP pyrophosphokinase [Streptococcus sp. DD12]KXT76590.1 GTP pyrophosphokinase [Streptococcus sp. DD12]